jgi:hypothetical protein
MQLSWKAASVGLLLLACIGVACARADSSRTIDGFVAAAWARDKVQPAPLAADAEFVRRIYLDLVGRIPTKDEALRFVNDRRPDKRAKLTDELLSGGEFPKHWRENLNALFRGGPAFGGNPQWRAWLEQALQRNEKWDAIARDMLLPQAEPKSAGAWQFLLSRLAQGDSGLDLVTRDVSRFFFGVDIQCARCHKHPDVSQWKQESYWGMAAYFSRSYPIAVKGQMFLAERARGEVEYTTRTKVVKTAYPMFLTGEKLQEQRPPAKATGSAPSKAPAKTAPAPPPMDDPADYLVPPETAKDKTRVPVPKFSRRAKFVATAINVRDPYFKRAAVNIVWASLMGRGLVEPIDQMHEGNPPSHPELLQFLADDFAAHQFDLRYLIRTIANSRSYQQSSRYPGEAPRPPEQAFAHGLVRSLTMQQLGPALLVATGYYDAIRAASDPATRTNSGALRAKLEAKDAGLLTSFAQNLDGAGGGSELYQPGIREALFQENSAAFADFIAKGGLSARLAAMPDDAGLVEEMFLCVLSRPPTVEEAGRLRGYLQTRSGRRQAACEQMVWALLTSSEFRFNH